MDANDTLAKNNFDKDGPLHTSFSGFTDISSTKPYYDHLQPLLPFQRNTPTKFIEASNVNLPAEPVFDPKIHLALGDPKQILNLDFQTRSPNNQVQVHGTQQSQLAYTTAFQVLSDEGVKAIRQILDRNEKFLIKSSPRIPKYVRGLAYASKFIRDLNECPELLNHLSKFAGQRVVPHYLHMNYAHTNYGKVPKPGEVNKIPVDQWHLDSVPFVLIIIISDLRDMVGGVLECVKRRGNEGFELIAKHNNQVPPSELLQVPYEKQGYALFMQGSEIVHHVTPVQSGREERITLVNSYMPANPYADDRTRYHTFVHDGAEKESILEFARGRAWRNINQLQGFIDKQVYTENKNDCVEVLTRVRNELNATIDLLSERKMDVLGFYDEAKNKPSAQIDQGSIKSKL